MGRLGSEAGRSMSGFHRRIARIMDASGVRNWRWHDLRRTVRTGLARLGVPDTVAELAIGHISGRSSLVRTYDRHDYAAEAEAALRQWQSHVAGLVGPAPMAEVVPLRPATEVA
jgi:hypothetical protein